MSKILFIYPNLLQSENISLGIAYLSAALKKEGHETDLFDFTFTRSKRKLLKKVKEFEPEYVCFSARSGEYRYCGELAEYMTNNYTHSEGYKPYTCIGGPHVSAHNGIEKGYILFDLYFCGEADKSLPHTIKSLPNLSTFDNVVPEIPITNLEELPYPDYDLFDIQRYINIIGGLEVISSRGCPYRCTYCINGGSCSPKFRQKSPEYFVEELAYLSKKYMVNKFFFQDDMFVSSEKWLEEFYKVLRLRQYKFYGWRGLEFTCNIRPEMLTNRVANLLRVSNCTSVNIGIESGSYQVRKSLLNRKVNDVDIANAFFCAKKWGLKTYAYSMIGIPSETKDELKQTIKLNKYCEPDHLQCSVFQPYPGTPLAEKISKPQHYRESHQFLPKHCYAEYSKLYLWFAKCTFRFRVLFARNKIKALTLLIYDILFPITTLVRRYVPQSVKKLFLKIVGGK